MLDPALLPRLRAHVEAQPYPLLFATVSGAHLYGFDSPDSDFDLRGAHVLPAREVLGLTAPEETRTATWDDEGLEIDLVSHDVRKFFTLMLKTNGYVLEQVTSPLVVWATPEFEELKSLVPRCVTRHHVHHYLGFFRTEWRQFEREPRLKPLLYCYRVLLTGIHLMRTGEVEANLRTLAPEYGCEAVLALVEAKAHGTEHEAFEGDPAEHAHRLGELEAELKRAGAETKLPDVPKARADLNNLLVRLRLGPI